MTTEYSQQTSITTTSSSANGMPIQHHEKQKLPWFFPAEYNKESFPKRRSRIKRQQKLQKQKQHEQNQVQHQDLTKGTSSISDINTNDHHHNEDLEAASQQPQPTSIDHESTSASSKSWADLARGKNTMQQSAGHKRTTSNVNGSSKTDTITAMSLNGRSTSSSSSSSSTAPSSGTASTIETPPLTSVAPTAPVHVTAPPPTPEVTQNNRKPLGQVLQSYRNPEYAPHELFARGLINTGNICFMNSIIQALVHCSPFYRLLELVSNEAAFSLKSETPIVDGLVDLFREVKRVEVDDKKNKLQTPVTPDSFYTVLSNHVKFSHLERGRQEDAEEFLGYLLEAIHEEFANALKKVDDSSIYQEDNDDEWTEIGKGNKPVDTRHSGMNVDSPISRLFGGKFRSSLNIPGQRPSITFDPFQHVQLDIDDSNVASVEDAFKFMSRPENIRYRTNSSEVGGSKTVVFEKLPPVLIVHLKRFTFEHQSGSQKNSKAIRFDTDLVIPENCIAKNRRGEVGTAYSLFAVVYHHGPSAQAGHYTVNVKSASSSKEWIHIDDIALSKTDKVCTDTGSQTAYLLFYVQKSHY